MPARARITRALGHVPPYATAAQGGPIDVTPEGARRRRSISAPPGQEVSASEFQEMVRELDVERRPSASTAARGDRRRPAARPAAGAHAPGANGGAAPPAAAPLRAAGNG